MFGYSSFLEEDKEAALLQVFAQLNLKELVLCTRVCKTWKTIIDMNLKCKTLIVHNDVYPCETWSFDNSPLNPSESVKVYRLNRFFRSNLVTSISKDIQKLLLHCQLKGGFFRELNILNSFPELRELEILGVKLELPNEYKLKLEKLRFLKFFEVPDALSNPKIYLEAPKLTTIVGSFDKLQLSHPETVRTLEMRNCQEKDCLTTLVNLEHLICERIDSIERNFLSKLKNLKTIQFHQSFDYLIRDLHNQKSDLHRTNLQIQFLGINCSEEEYLKLYYVQKNNRIDRNAYLYYRDYYRTECKHEVSRFQCLFELDESNYKLYLGDHRWEIAEIIPFATQLRFKVIEQNSDKLLLFGRFINIKEINVNHQLANEKLFFKFIQKQRRLTTLRFERSNFKQSQFDSLCQYVPMLVELYVRNEPDTLAYDFLLNFRNLSIIKTDQFINLDIVNQLCHAESKLISVIGFYSYSSLFKLTWQEASATCTWGKWNLTVKRPMPGKCIFETVFDEHDSLDDITLFLDGLVEDSKKRENTSVVTDDE